MRISDWSSDVCSSDLVARGHRRSPGILTKLAQRTSHSGGWIMRCRHLLPSHFRLAYYVARRFQYLDPDWTQGLLEGVALGGLQTTPSKNKSDPRNDCAGRLSTFTA